MPKDKWEEELEELISKDYLKNGNGYGSYVQDYDDRFLNPKVQLCQVKFFIRQLLAIEKNKGFNAGLEKAIEVIKKDKNLKLDNLNKMTGGWKSVEEKAVTATVMVYNNLITTIEKEIK